MVNMTNCTYPSSDEMIPVIQRELLNKSPIGILVDASKTTGGSEDELTLWCHHNARHLMGWQIMQDKHDFIRSYNNAKPNLLNLYILEVDNEETMKLYREDPEIMEKVKYIYRI